jgi:GNAT superfamily N-acetyltransferase
VIVIRLLREQDDRESFDCAHRDLNDFLHGLDYEADIASGRWRVWVAVHDSDDREILSYYAASPDPARIVEEGAASPGVTYQAIHLVCLATDHRRQRRGYARNLVIHAMKQAVQAAGRCDVEAAMDERERYIADFPVESAEMYRIDFLFVRAVDERARDWYLRRNLGLTPLSEGSLTLAITTEAMRDLIAGE